MNILFLHCSRHTQSPWKDGSTRYRCYHLAEALRASGHLADVAPLQDFPRRTLARYSIVCVLRPQTSKILTQILKHCRQLGIHTVADVDDLIFIPEYATISPSVVNQQASEFAVAARFKRNLQAMLCFDEITVATRPLAQHWISATGKQQVTVVPNGLSLRWLKTRVNRIDRMQPLKYVITYLPGSRSHNKDFSHIANVLVEFLHDQTEIRLHIVGQLDFDKSKFPASQLHCSESVDYYRLPQIIANSYVTLAPLLNSPFTHAKSHIKYIESAAFGTPVIASPNHDICRHESFGLHIACSDEQWHTALYKTLEQRSDSQNLDNMEQLVRANFTATQSADTLLKHWQPDSKEPLLSDVA